MTSMADHTEEGLVAQLREGSERAFMALYNRLHEKIFFYARHYVHTIEDAEDFTADAFVQLWQRRDEQPSLDAIAAFLHVTVRNRCLNLKKQQRADTLRQQLLHEQTLTDPFYTGTIQLELLKEIYEEVERLPPRLKEIFLLSYREGLKPAEIATRLNLSVQRSRTSASPLFGC